MMRRLFGAMGLIGAMVVAAPGAADAKPRTTRVVGHVSAGSPIKGATMRVYGPTGRRLKVLAKRSVTKTTSDGFFNLVVRDRPSKVRLVATGVTVRHEHVKGTLDLIQMKQSIDESTFNSAVAPLQELAGEVEATQGYFQDIIDNRLATVFSKDLYQAREADIRDNLRDITKRFQGTGNVFRSAILKDGLSNPAYYYAGQNLLSHTQFFMTQSGSLQLARFAEFVLHYQSLAFNLIVQWENSLGAGEHPLPNTTLKNAVQQYLGFTVEEARDWMDQNASIDTPSIPAKGDLHDEITYLETIKPVPAHAVVQADELGHAQGPMWSTDIGTIELGRTIAARPGQAGYPCAGHLNGSLPVEGKPACEFMGRGWADGQDQLNTARDKLPGTDWAPANADQTQAFFTRVKTLSKGDRDNILALKTDYWCPPEFTTQASQYYVNSQDPAHAGWCNVNTDAHCSWLATWVDEVSVTTFSSDPAKPFKATCRFGVEKRKGGTCPVLSVLFRRDTKPAEGERYWPSY